MATDENKARPAASRWPTVVAAAVVVWMALHILHANRFIYHDSWRHGFPMIYRVTQLSSGCKLPGWLDGVDSGAPTLLYALSCSLFNPVRLVLIALESCLQPDVATAMYIHKASLFANYLVFTLGMYVLGRVLFTEHAVAGYLVTATLFAGLAMENLHSDQTANIIFWIPWAAAAAALFHRHRESPRGAWYLAMSVVLLCAQGLDQHPCFVALPAGIAFLTYVILWPRASASFLGRNYWRLWPAYLAVAIFCTDLYVLQKTIADYRPSLREAVRVDPSTMGETGFVQATAFPIAFVPLTFDRSFVALAERTTSFFGQPFSICRVNSLAYNVGLLPIVLMIGFIIVGPRQRRLRFGYLAVFACVMAVSLQWSFIYYPLSLLPGFNAFRSYSLYILYLVFMALVMSAYGLDTLMKLDTEQRRRFVWRSIWATLLLVGIALAVVGLTLRRPPNPIRLLGMLRLAWCDLLLGGATLAAVAWSLGRRKNPDLTLVLVTFAAAQLVYFCYAYNKLGMNGSELLAEYTAGDGEAFDRRRPRDPERCRRVESDRFAFSYVSRHDTYSFRKDLEGTFLRSIHDALYAPDLDPSVVRALAGVSHPVFWLSENCVFCSNRADLTVAFNDHRDQIQSYLRQVVHVPEEEGHAWLATQGKDSDEASGGGTFAGAVTSWSSGLDRFDVSYRANRSTFLNAAVNWDSGWIARVNGRIVPVFRGNFSGLAIPLPAGAGEISLEYRSASSELFMATRYVLCVSSILIVLGMLLYFARGFGRSITMRG